MTERPTRGPVPVSGRKPSARWVLALPRASPVRLLLLICVTIGLTHSLAMLMLHGWSDVLPSLGHSLSESLLLVVVLFPALYYFSFRPLYTQIAEREHAEAVMRESEHKYHQLFNNLGDAAFLIESESRVVVDVNQQAERLLGHVCQEILGTQLDRWLPPDRPEEHAAQLSLHEADAVVSFETEMETAPDRRIPMHVSAAPLNLHGRELVIVLFRDITELKTLHNELLHAQRLESVGALASGIAHDLNNALTPVLFATELLRSRPEEKPELRLLNTISTSATRASQIVRQMLKFVRGGENSRSEVQLRHLIREAADMAEVSFPKSIRVNKDLPNDLWTVQADAAQISQVLMNLAVNARDAMSDGGELSFSAENLVLGEKGLASIAGAKSGAYVSFSVSDTGCGIPPEIKERIFEPFFTTKPVGKGTGLGLATCRDIVRDHGGHIQVASQPGRGSIFRIYLPAIPGSLATLEVRPEAPPKGHGELVLIADDEAAILEMTRLALEAANYRVLQAHDGTEALAFGAEHKDEIGLAILDVGMPYLNGDATMRALHKVIPALLVILMSGSAAPASAGKDQGGAAFLQKPFSSAQLLELVSSALHGKRA